MTASAADSETPPPPPPPTEGDRRSFLKTAACAVFGGACILPPAAIGIVVLTAPIRELSGGGIKVKLSTLDALPKGGAPRMFEVLIERTDAWTRHDRSAVGAVYLQRTGEREIRAFNVSCPHLGCAVEWRKEKSDYFCPCHDSAFTADGAIVQPSPAARGLDTLDVEINDNGEIFVVFQDFKAGISEKIPVA